MKKNFPRLAQYVIVILILILISFTMFLCTSTAFYSREPSLNSLATISKSKLETQTSREEIAKELANVWMRKYQIGTLGWTDWIWKYEIEKVEFWDSTSECVNIHFKVLTVLPSDITSWMDYYARKDGIWIKNRYTMFLSEHDTYYELYGPISLC